MPRAQVDKKVRYEESLRDEGNTILRSEFKDPRLTFISFTRVDLNDDYSMAKFYWDTFDAHHRGDAKHALEKITGKLRSLLAKKLEFRHTPQIQFFYDSQFESEKNIEKLLQDAKEVDEE